MSGPERAPDELVADLEGEFEMTFGPAMKEILVGLVDELDERYHD